MNTNNPFEQNKNQNTPDPNNNQFDPNTRAYSPYGQGENGTPAQSQTYGQVYTPEGPDRQTPGNSGYSTQSYSGSYPTGGNPGNTFDPSAKKSNPNNQGRKNNTATVAVISCCIVAVLVVLGCISFAMLSMVGMLTDRNDPAKLTADNESTLQNPTENDANDSENATDNGTVPESSEDEAPTVSKNPGETTDVSGGKIGQLMTMSEAVALIKDSVVEINTEHMVTGSIYGQYIASGAGSGVIVAKEGYIITNNHVVSGAKAIRVTLTNGNKYDAKLIGTDSATDIAVIKIEPKETLTTATLGSSENLVLAEDVIVIGNPLGSLGGTVTCGIISALDRQITVEGEKMTLLQTNAAVNPGNSGGGLFNLRGELVGIVNAKSTGENVEGLGFAVPINTAYTVFNQLVEFGYVRGRVDHGLNLVDINDWFMATSYRVNAFGVYVLESKYSDEIKNGDRIVSVNGSEINASSDINTALSECAVGDKVKIVIARNGKTIEATLTLREYNPTSSGDVSFD